MENFLLNLKSEGLPPPPTWIIFGIEFVEAMKSVENGT
jgi:hypothetical protein